MKKIALIFALVVGFIALNGCTDNTLEDLEKRNEEQKEIKFVDPSDNPDPETDIEPEEETGN